METDIRIIENLTNGCNDTYDDTNMWLAPFTGNNKNHLQYKRKKNLPYNIVYLLLEKPIAINFWNYSKTPARGEKN